MTKAVEDFVKSVPLVWGLAVRLLVVPGVLRASVGVDCFVPCPPSVAPRTLNPKCQKSKSTRAKMGSGQLQQRADTPVSLFTPVAASCPGFGVRGAFGGGSGNRGTLFLEFP